MRVYSPNEPFNIILTTQRTLIGADVSKFKVLYANVSAVDNWTSVSGSMIEARENITTPHTAEANATDAGALSISVKSGHTIVSGNVIQYATGKYGYVLSANDTTLVLKRPIKSAITQDYVLTQVGNTGDYATPMISIGAVGEYAIVIEAPEYNIMAQSRVSIKEPTLTNTTSYETVSVAY